MSRRRNALKCLLTKDRISLQSIYKSTMKIDKTGIITKHTHTHTEPGSKIIAISNLTIF